MIIDDVKIQLTAGKGGDGAATFRREKFVAKGGPDGGNGGRGGDIIIEIVSDISALKPLRNKTEIAAENGGNGMRKKKHGKDGEDTIIKVPAGTTLTDLDSDQRWECEKVGNKFILCKGGHGGRGNFEFRSAQNQAPREFEYGQPGKTRHIHCNLKFIADIGLIGLPSAGKSSLLNALTKAEAKVGAYPFTTLEPNLGVLHGLIIADIPGLIEGAHEGKGLGDRFLKHIEKTKVLLHCIDITSDDPLRDYATIRKELTNFNPSLANKKEIVLLTKSDMVDDKEVTKIVKKLSKKLGEVLTVSIINDSELKQLTQILTSL